MNFKTEFTGSNTQITATDGGNITSEHPPIDNCLMQSEECSVYASCLEKRQFGNLCHHYLFQKLGNYGFLGFLGDTRT